MIARMVKGLDDGVALGQAVWDLYARLTKTKTLTLLQSLSAL